MFNGLKKFFSQFKDFLKEIGWKNYLLILLTEIIILAVFFSSAYFAVYFIFEGKYLLGALLTLISLFIVTGIPFVNKKKAKREDS